MLVLNWNGAADTVECLHSLAKLEHDGFETVVIDNGSADDSVRIVRERFPAVTLIESGRNLGFAGGNNLGIEYALGRNAKFVLLLNNDTIVAPLLLRRFLEAAEAHPEAGAFAAKVYFYEEPTRLRFAGARWDEGRAQFSIVGFGQEDEASGTDRIAATPWGSGCAVLIRAEVLREVGLLDERFFLMWEEVDWCSRARAAGHETLLVPQAKVWHKKASSFEPLTRDPLVSYYHLRNRLLWIERHLGRRRLLALFRRAIWPQLKRRLRTFASGKGDAGERTVARAELYGVLHYVIRRFGEAPAHIARHR